MKKKLLKLATAFTIIATMLICGTISSFAAAPYIEEIEFKNNGRVEVDFRGKVRYKNSKISVKDTQGKSYTVKNIIRDDDDVKFVIKNFKRGKTYKIAIKGIKTRGSSKFGKVIGKLKVPAAATGKNITASAAVKKAKQYATKSWKAKDLWDIEVESDRYRGQSVWEVSFNGIISGEPYEFEFKISKKGGKILRKEKEWDD